MIESTDRKINGTLNATGAVDFDSTLNVDGAVTVNNVIKAAGASGIDLQDDGGNSALKIIDGGYLNNANQKRVSSQFDKTNNTLADVTGLSVALPASGTFRFTARIFATAPAIVSVGAKFGIGYSGTNSLFRAAAFAHISTTVGVQSALVSATGLVLSDGGGGSGASYYVEIEGVITSSGAGNLTVQFAQNTTNATASSVLTGSTLEVWQLT